MIWSNERVREDVALAGEIGAVWGALVRDLERELVIEREKVEELQRENARLREALGR